jgi:hypothetical protein
MSSDLKAFQERFTVGAVLAAKQEKTDAEKFQLLYQRGVLNWDEVAEEFTERGLGDPVPYIGTREDDAKAREVLP